jgi:hypothetical protein
MYQFLQTPPSENIIIPANAYENKNTTWNADVHLISTYCFLSNEESALFAAEDQVYLVKDVFEYKFYNITGTSRLPLTSNGMISSWMWFLQRNDVNMRNEWGNYTNWPYSTIPGQIIITPFNEGEPPPNDIPPSVTVGVTNIGYGPQYNPDGTNTGYYYTGDFANYNTKEILVSMGIILNGEYRENILESGVYNYVEKYTRTQGSAVDYLYCYNFCLNTNPFEYQPSGAINLSKFRTIELEVTTIVPPIDPGNSLFNIICDTNGNAIGVTKSNWQLNYYNYNMTLFEERYNVLTFVGGNCGMLYSR